MNSASAGCQGGVAQELGPPAARLPVPCFPLHPERNQNQQTREPENPLSPAFMARLSKNQMATLAKSGCPLNNFLPQPDLLPNSTVFAETCQEEQMLRSDKER